MLKLVVVDAAIVDTELKIQNVKLFEGPDDTQVEQEAHEYAFNCARAYDPHIKKTDCFRDPFGDWAVELRLV